MFIIEFILQLMGEFIKQNDVKNNRANKIFIVSLSVFLLGIAIIWVASILNK